MSGTIGRDAWWDVGRDVGYALRGLRRRPIFTAVAVTTLALGVGASTAVFSVVDATVLRALPYREAGRLVSLGTLFDDAGPATFGLSDAEYLDYRDEQTSFVALGAYAPGEVTWLPDDGDPTRVPVVWLYPGLLDVLDVRTAQGRLPTSEEIVPGVPPALLVSHEAWRRRFGGDPSIVGSTLSLGGTRVAVLGVLAPGTRLPDGAPDLWLVRTVDRGAITDRSGHYLTGVGRLATGASLAGARAEIEAVHARWRERFAGVHSPGHPGHRIAAAPLADVVLGGSRRVAVVLAAAAGLLLLLACVNVAGLLVARSEGRLAEMGVRTAMGAGRSRLARQLLVESLLLAGVAGAVGYLLAGWGTGALIASVPDSLPGLDRVAPDGRTLAFALLAALGTGAVFGLVPVLRIPREGAARLLRGAGRGGTTGTGRLLPGLVVGQVAVATVVVVAAGLLLRSRAELTAVDPGFRGEGAVVFDLEIPSTRAPDLPAVEAFWAELDARLEALPGVEEAAIVRNLPLRSPVRRENIRLEAGAGFDADTVHPVVVQAVGPGYLDAMGIGLVEGRGIADTDRSDAPPVAVVNEAAARAYWPDGAVGARFAATFGFPEDPPYTIVGVARNVRHESLEADVEPEIYLPYGQIPGRGWGWGRRATVLVGTAESAATLAPALRQVVHEMVPTAPVEDLAPIADVLAGATARMRFLSLLVALFAAVALLIAGVGVYGILSYLVARRRREMGVRLAIGASPLALLRSVVASGARLAIGGVALGLGGALSLGPVLASVLFGVSPRDGVALALGPLILFAVVLLATWIPARRAGRVSPLESLQAEA